MRKEEKKHKQYSWHTANLSSATSLAMTTPQYSIVLSSSNSFCSIGFANKFVLHFGDSHLFYADPATVVNLLNANPDPSSSKTRRLKYGKFNYQRYCSTKTEKGSVILNERFPLRCNHRENNKNLSVPSCQQQKTFQRRLVLASGCDQINLHVGAHIRM